MTQAQNRPEAFPSGRIAAMLALTTLASLLLGGLVVGLVMQNQVLGLKNDMPRFVAEEMQAMTGIRDRSGLLDEAIEWFMDLDIVEDLQGRVETRAVRQSTGPIVGAYLAVTAGATLAAWFVGREIDKRRSARAGRSKHEAVRSSHAQGFVEQAPGENDNPRHGR